ncbi:GD18188 [Drosophila simulans]|uniref:GD18188 n=1 Tax=Drosophila simulans TaxID=7240 RepID=B4QVB9_DROSI|nr:GD18188 [Drosophila simulans]
MALRLTTIALLHRAPLLVVPKLKAAPPTRTLLLRKNLVPFLDDDPCVFSKKAIMHHWGAVPIIAISLLSLTAEVIAWLVIALTRHDVSYTANSAHYECLETRSSLYYPAKYLKFMKFNQKCEVPQGLIQANQGDTAGASFDDKKKNSLNIQSDLV